ncbi:MAG: isoaspartyl peptidase/L-asparaginase, partial [Acidobacteria bacterium]|nr:isoaspartyl peptidase/L-asparaginase [Acidobacteriota bacterium]
DAAIMDGRDQDCGAVSGVKTVKNPIRLARKVMDESRHVFLSGSGAEAFAAEQGLEQVDPEYFFVQKRYDQWREAVAAEEATGGTERREGKLGTVGAAVLDRHGNLAAGNSTGGLTNKRFGRVGDVPIIGAGTFASNRSAAVACTGVGEQFIRNTVARDVAARVEFAGQDLESAVREVLFERLEEGDGGLVAVDRLGKIVMMFNAEGMYRGAADSSGRFEVGIW